MRGSKCNSSTTTAEATSSTGQLLSIDHPYLPKKILYEYIYIYIYIYIDIHTCRRRRYGRTDQESASPSPPSFAPRYHQYRELNKHIRYLQKTSKRSSLVILNLPDPNEEESAVDYMQFIQILTEEP